MRSTAWCAMMLALGLGATPALAEAECEEGAAVADGLCLSVVEGRLGLAREEQKLFPALLAMASGHAPEDAELALDPVRILEAVHLAARIRKNFEELGI